MFLSLDQIAKSLKKLEQVDTFYLTTFLVFKANKLPVGSDVVFPIINKDTEFLEKYYKPNVNSRHYYRVSRTSDSSKRWLGPKTPRGTLQSVRARGSLAPAFIHSNSKSWGWQQNYIEVLESNLYRQIKIPIFDLSVWLFRERNWPLETNSQDIILAFINEFNITQDELYTLFDANLPDDLDENHLFQAEQITWSALQTVIGNPPDAPGDENGTLAYLELQGVGPSLHLRFEPADRLNLITGDNGLGKTFLLECAWWALTGNWSGLPAHPRSEATNISPKITFQISGGNSLSDKFPVSYDWKKQSWPIVKKRPTMPGLSIYARVDGSFAVCDPAQSYMVVSHKSQRDDLALSSFTFTRDDIWNGFNSDDGRSLINGLISDLVLWQYNPERYPFSMFENVLKHLSPEEMGPLVLGDPVRLAHDRREIPTIKLLYGDVPIVHIAAGMRRILTLAYLIVWAWEEHKTQSKLARREPQRQMVIMIDEIEAHLHPKWQRLILPTLLEIQSEFDVELDIQFLVTTHSPLVTASIEPIFNTDMDKIFHLKIPQSNTSNNDVQIEEIPFTPLGSFDSWLTSDLFDLDYARAIEPEQALKDATALQLQSEPVDAAKVREVTERLLKYLPADDKFWPRWIYFAEKYGIML